jgi:hypothetical protein
MSAVPTDSVFQLARNVMDDCHLYQRHEISKILINFFSSIAFFILGGMRRAGGGGAGVGESEALRRDLIAGKIKPISDGLKVSFFQFCTEFLKVGCNYLFF